MQSRATTSAGHVAQEITCQVAQARAAISDEQGNAQCRESGTMMASRAPARAGDKASRDLHATRA